MAEYRTRIIYIVDELGLSTARVIDRSIDANPFHRSDVFYQYIGVYDYTTVSGRYNGNGSIQESLFLSVPKPLFSIS